MLAVLFSEAPLSLRVTLASKREMEMIISGESIEGKDKRTVHFKKEM